MSVRAFTSVEVGRTRVAEPIVAALVIRALVAIVVVMAIATPLDAAPLARVMPSAPSTVEGLISADRLRDPLIAVGGPHASRGLILATGTDLHAALHEAITAQGLVAGTDQHLALHRAVLRIGPDLASETAIC